MSNEATENCFGGFEIGTPGPWQVTASDGDVFEAHDTQEAATAVAKAWNAQTDPLERTHKAAYPFRVEHRTQRAIDAQLERLELSNASNGRSALVCRIDDDGAVLADVEDWHAPMAPEELCAILEAIDSELSLGDIREELASELQAQ